jgi:putative methyltransferase (TIGR04325 family)
MLGKNFKQSVRDWIPPAIIPWFRGLRKNSISFRGCYSSWLNALEHATGYNTDQILQKVTESLLKVKLGLAVYERDSVIFDKIEHSYPLLAGLLRAAATNEGKLTVIDFGGSLGSTYYQCRDFLSGLPKLNWCIVEQPIFVQRGRELFESEQLRFFSSMQECVDTMQPNVVLFSAVLPYLENPLEVLNLVMEAGVDFIIIDRTQFSELNADHLCIQHVPPGIYSATYPCWILSESKLKEAMTDRYKIVADFNAFGGKWHVTSGPTFTFRGMIFEKKKLHESSSS